MALPGAGVCCLPSFLILKVGLVRGRKTFLGSLCALLPPISVSLQEALNEFSLLVSGFWWKGLERGVGLTGLAPLGSLL